MLLGGFPWQYLTENPQLWELVGQIQEIWCPLRNLELFQRLELCQVTFDPLRVSIQTSSSPFACA